MQIRCFCNSGMQNANILICHIFCKWLLFLQFEKKLFFAFLLSLKNAFVLAMVSYSLLMCNKYIVPFVDQFFNVIIFCTIMLYFECIQSLLYNFYIHFYSYERDFFVCIVLIQIIFIIGVNRAKMRKR